MNTAITIEDSEISSLSDRQDRIVSILPIIPALLSCICSCILLHLTKSWQAPYQRILFGLSVFDLFTSVSFALQPFLVPQETSQRVWALGNDASCSALGFLSQLTLASLLYNGLLSFYYFMTIRYAVSEANFWKYEKYLHGLCVVYPLLTASVGAILGVYHEVELGPGCWVSDWPEGCGDDKDECKSPLVAWLFNGIWVFLSMICVLVFNVCIYRFVRSKLIQSIRRSMNRDTQLQRLQLVASQAFLYVFAFWGTFIFTVVLRIMESRNYDAHDEDRLFPLLVLQSILVPSAGIFNLLIFARPKYLRIRKDHGDQSRFWAWQRALFGEPATRNRPSFFTFSFFRRTKHSGERAGDLNPMQEDTNGSMGKPEKDENCSDEVGKAAAPEQKP